MTEQGEGQQGQGQGQGRGDGSGGQSGGEGEGGTPLTPIGPGDIITITSARRMEYPLPDVLEPAYKTASGWRQKTHSRKAVLDVKAGEQYVLQGESPAQGKVFWGSGSIARDSNLGVDGELGIYENGTLLAMWIAGGASGPQFETVWGTNLMLKVSELVIENSVPPPPGQPGQVGGPGDFAIRWGPNGGFIQTNADGSESEIGADGTWLSGAPPGGYKGAGPSPFLDPKWAVGSAYSMAEAKKYNEWATITRQLIEEGKNIPPPDNAAIAAWYEHQGTPGAVVGGGTGAVNRGPAGPLLPADGLLGVGAIGIILLLIWAVTRDG